MLCAAYHAKCPLENTRIALQLQLNADVISYTLRRLDWYTDTRILACFVCGPF